LEVPGDPCSVKRKYIVDVAGRLPVILLVMDAGNNNSVERSYVYAGAQPIAFYEGDYTDPNYFYLHDRLGSVRQVIDSSGNVKNTHTYTPFGRLLASESAESTENPYKFTAQWYAQGHMLTISFFLCIIEFLFMFIRLALKPF